MIQVSGAANPELGAFPLALARPVGDALDHLPEKAGDLVSSSLLARPLFGHHRRVCREQPVPVPPLPALETRSQVADGILGRGQHRQQQPEQQANGFGEPDQSARSGLAGVHVPGMRRASQTHGGRDPHACSNQFQGDGSTLLAAALLLSIDGIQWFPRLTMGLKLNEQLPFMSF